MRRTLRINERKLDWVFVFFMVMFSLFSFFGDSTPATGRPTPESSWFMRPLIYSIYAMNKDPLVLQSPVFVRVACFFAAFIFGPFQLVAAWAIYKGKQWIRTPMLIYLGGVFEGSFIFVWAAIFGDAEFFARVCNGGSSYDYVAQNMAWVMGFNIWYVTVPLVMMWRFWRDRPFEARR